MKVIGVKDLNEMIQYLRKPESYHIEEAEILLAENKEKADFCEIKGQESLRRAVEIAVSGFHNLLMIGPPGAGKTMVAKRIPGIMPPLTLEEGLELTKIYSIAGLLSRGDPLIRERPFRLWCEAGRSGARTIPVLHRHWQAAGEIRDRGKSRWHTEACFFWMRCRSFQEGAWRS